MIDRATIQRVMDATDIVDVVKEFVTLRKSGANYKGLCPFHNERTPSFSVSPAKQLCKCFSCGKGGNAVHFLMELEQMTYPEAIKWLGRKYGIEVKEKELTDTERIEQSERESMGVCRAVGAYGSGMVIAILTIPITNALGGNQNAWIKYGFIMALLVLLMLSICYMNGRKAKLVDEVSENDSQDEEEAIPLKKSIPMLFKNKYWVILILFNLITQITNSIAATSGTYYCKWIFGNDNLVALAGALGFFATLVGFVVSKPIIAKLGVRKTIDFGVLGAAFTALIRCIIPTNFKVYIAVSVIGSFVQIPLMCLYGVLLAMVIDYNEYTYYNKMVGVSSGAIGIGTKIGSGVGSVILTACLALGAYNPDLEVATTSMRYAIYAFSNYLPLIINLGLFVLFRFFDLEEKLPAIHEELARRRSQKSTEQ